MTGSSQNAAAARPKVFDIGFHKTVECTRQSNDKVFTAIVERWEARETSTIEAQAALTKGIEPLRAYEAALKVIMALPAGKT